MGNIWTLLPAWTAVRLERRRLGQIYLDEDLVGGTSTREHLNQWCEDHCGDLWIDHVGVENVEWGFQDARDAVLFRLTWS